MPPTEQPEVTPSDDGHDGEPTAAEIKAAADREAREATARAKQAARTPPTEKRGPGRPPGARNRPKGQKQAATTAKTTTTRPTTPRALPAGNGGDGDDADRAARKAQREARAARVAELVAEVKEHRPGFVIGVGTVTGLPVQYLVQPRMHNGQPVIDADTQQPIPELTVYGAQLAPKDWQIRTAAEAYVRIEESDIGERVADAFDKWAPYLFMVAGLGAAGFYAFSTLQIADALKPMIAEEIRLASQQAGAQQQETSERQQAAG